MQFSVSLNFNHQYYFFIFSLPKNAYFCQKHHSEIIIKQIADFTWKTL
jgi:hypothetical protein